MKQADRIRLFIISGVIEPAKATGCASLAIRAGDVHRAMGLVNAYPAVCSALRGAKLQHEARIVLKGHEGPENGANVWFRFDLLAAPPASSQHPLQTPTKTTPRSNGSVSFQHALVLISCSKKKLVHAAPARDLYCSTAFQMKRTMVERAGASWVILSAKHGTVEPKQIIAPYDSTLTAMGVALRRDWASRVLPKLVTIAKSFERVISLAGQRYGEHLLDPLAAEGIEVIEPLKGLRQGEQLAWLSAHQ